MSNPTWDEAYRTAEPHFPHWEKTKDIIDQFIDLTLDFRQSGHPGGSRSKVHAFLSLLMSGAMRWDIRRPDKPFNDRFVLIAGHTVPLVYCTLAALHEALRLRHAETGDARYAVRHGARWSLTWEDLLDFRRRGGLAGHAEFEGKTLLLRFNTGPSGHGFPAAVGMAMGLKRAGADGVRVFAMEGEGGLTTGTSHESMNSAWGLGLDNLVVMLDWNDYGIDPRPASSVVYGTPTDWFAPHGWRVYGAEDGADWASINRALLSAVREPDTGGRPAAVWFRTRKGRGYGKFDYASHGTPHKRHASEFWACREEFSAKYGCTFEGLNGPAPDGLAAQRARAAAHFATVAGVMKADPALYRDIADRLVEIGESVPEGSTSARVAFSSNPWRDPEILDPQQYPREMWVEAGEKAPNRQSLGAWGSYVNSWARRKYGRPLFLAMSADLAESTNIAGFAKPFGEWPNYGWYERGKNPEGVLLPQEITEFTNSGIAAGIASVNFSDDPEFRWDGFGAAHSTYGSFSYLKYGLMRLYSQLAQDGDFKVGPVIWVAGHSGPETAEDSRTHFGIYEPSVTQLFPEGHVVDLHPWEANEVPVMLGAALATGVPIIALHVTRPAIPIPDRAALGMPSHFEAARGAYVMRDYDHARPKGGCVVIQGTITTANLVKVLPELDARGLNVKIVAALSPQLFALQPAAYRDAVLGPADRIDAMGITNRSRDSMRRWLGTEQALTYTLSADWDDRWRTGGSVEEVVEEARLDGASIISGIERFVRERDERLGRIEQQVAAARARRA